MQVDVLSRLEASNSKGPYKVTSAVVHINYHPLSLSSKVITAWFHQLKMVLETWRSNSMFLQDSDYDALSCSDLANNRKNSTSVLW